MKEREDGWYWVKCGETWEVALFQEGRWFRVATLRSVITETLGKVGPPVLRPEEVG